MKKPTIMIGRKSENADFDLSDCNPKNAKFISRNHATLHFKSPNKFFLQNHSRNGVKVNEVLYDAQGEIVNLEPKDSITIAKFTLRFLPNPKLVP